MEFVVNADRSVSPVLASPIAPTAESPLLVTMAPARAGKSYFWRMGSSSEFRFWGEFVFAESQLRIGMAARAHRTMPRTHAQLPEEAMMGYLGLSVRCCQLSPKNICRSSVTCELPFVPRQPTPEPAFPAPGADLFE